MNDRIPPTQCGPVLVRVKAKPSGWPTASPDPHCGRGPIATSGSPAHDTETTNLRSLRFQGIAWCSISRSLSPWVVIVWPMWRWFVPNRSCLGRWPPMPRSVG
jgi:hypothetical protein